MREAIEYYRGLCHALAADAPPATAEELRFWYLAEAVRLWDRVCTIDGETFSAYVLRSGVNLPVRLLRRRTVVLALLLTWPALAAILVRGHRGRRRAQWAQALRRPDLYAAFPGMSFSAEVVRARRADMFVAIYNASHYAATRSDAYALADKCVFAERARAAGLPVVDDLPLSTALRMPGPFIVKHPRRDMGLGVRKIESAADLVRDADAPDLLIQPCLDNHPQLAPLLPPRAPLCTLRITTSWDDRRAVAHIAYFRIGASDSPVDNVSRGGLLFEVDLRTGVLLRGYTHAMLHGRTPLRGVVRAPGADGDLSGEALPHFAAARALCERAHELLAPDLLSLGWDVALCERGPVLVECNVFAGSFEVQQLDDSYDRTAREVLRRLRDGAAGRPRP